MTRRLATAALTGLLIITLAVPATFFVAPQRVSAQSTASVGCIGGGLAGVITFFLPGVPTKEPVVGGATTATGISTIADCVQKLIILPLARQLIHQIIQSITASIINWINGNNGTGQPSFVQDLERHLQAVGDAVALPFINSIRRVLNPAFAAAIASSLLLKYAQGTSVGGFLSTARSTLGQYTTNQTVFLAGNFSQGGIPAWFALTTQDNNNPYTLAANADSALRNAVAGAQKNRKQDLTQSNGFLSWCGTDYSADTSAVGCPAGQVLNEDTLTCYYLSGGADSGATPTASAGVGGVAPGTSCIDKSGVPGKVKTPGIVIRDQVQQSLGAGLAQLINPADIDSAIAAIFGAALQQGINSIFGGTGLFGASFTSSVRPQAITTALQVSATASSGVINDANVAASTALSNLSVYSNSWTAVGNVAQGAQTALTSLKSFCTSQAGAADTALVSVNAVIADAQSSLNTVVDVQALARQVQLDAQDTTAAGVAKLNADLQALEAASPTTSDVSSAQVNATATGAATADPLNPLSVSGGTAFDQMTLINQNANAMINDPVACPIPDTITVPISTTP